jgi:hypothetical protein
MRNLALVFISGAIFGLGLVISEMTNPEKVRSFLRVFGNWDPSLLFVMLSAIVVSAPMFWILKKRRSQKQASLGINSNQKVLDGQLVTGAGLFGIGWGLVGFCPGPAVSSLSFGYVTSIIFMVAMIAGFTLSGYLKSSR